MGCLSVCVLCCVCVCARARVYVWVVLCEWVGGLCLCLVCVDLRSSLQLPSTPHHYPHPPLGLTRVVSTARECLLWYPPPFTPPCPHPFTVTSGPDDGHCSHPCLFTPTIHTTTASPCPSIRGRWYAPSPRHLRSLLSEGGGPSCGRLW